MTHFGVWLSTPHTAAVEMAAAAGYDVIVMDAEHGSFSLADLNTLVPFTKSLGLRAFVKAAAPERAPIQQALDFGADAVVIPHVRDVEHARTVTSFAKVPPLGDRSLAGGRTMGYGGFDDAWADAQNAATQCLPMIENEAALADVERIAVLDTVDGIFVGPGDLFIRRGTGGHTRGEQDFADLGRIGRAARAAGKPWALPAWSAEEKRFAAQEGADVVLLVQELSVLRAGFENALILAREAGEAE